MLPTVWIARCWRTLAIVDVQHDVPTHAAGGYTRVLPRVANNVR